MTVELERLAVVLDAKIGPYQRDLAAAQAQTSRQLAAMEARYAQWSSRLKGSASSAALGVGSALGGIAGYLGAQAVIV